MTCSSSSTSLPPLSGEAGTYPLGGGASIAARPGAARGAGRRLRAMERARVVVIGGGIAGVSVAYHLARAGWSDLVLLDKGELTSGSTHHAAGLVTQFNPSPTMMRFRRYSIALYEELGVFARGGS